MKLKALVLTLAVAALGVSVAAATASPRHGKPPHPGAQKPAKPSKAGDACRGPKVVLMGTYVSGSADSSGAGSFAMVVKRTNRHGRRLGLTSGTQVSVNVDAQTRIRRLGHATLADLQPQDLLNVKGRACVPPPSSSGDQSGSGSDQAGNPNAAPGKGHDRPRGRGLKGDNPTTASFTLLARKVDAHPPRTDGHDGGTTTGDTGTTGTTTDDSTGSTTTDD